MARSTVSALALSASTLLTFFTARVAAESYPIQQHAWYKDYYPQQEHYCVYGCEGAATSITFNYTPVSTNPDDYYLNECSNTLLLKSVLYCAQKYCTPEEARAGRDHLALQCEEVGVIFPTVEEATLSAAALDDILVLNYTAGLATATAPLGPGVAAIPDADWHSIAEKTVKEFYVNWDISFELTFALIGFWGLVIVVGMVHRLLVYTKKPVSRPSTSTLWLWIRKRLILPATIGQKQAESVVNTGTIPPRLETLLLALYFVMNIIMCFPGYHLFVGNLYYSTNKLQLARYIADRTGFLSVAQLPMLWVFAARNDPFLWLTGWSFATFNRFHRWIARISVLHAVVHSIAYSIFALYSDSYKISWKDEYWWCGGIATVVMCLMLGASAYYFREHYYDLFLMVHILMSVVFFVALWYHVRIFDGEFNYYLYPCIAIWALDRLLRVARTVAVSVLPRFAKGVKATATYNRNTNMVRLDISEFLTKEAIVPGIYYYLYLPAGLRGYESHPFTMCSWKTSAVSAPPSPSAPLEEKQISTTVRPPSEDYSTGDTVHTFLIRPYKGMTGRLGQKLLSADETTASSRETVFLEGPYGIPLNLSVYSDVLVLCGGSGITAAISHSHFLMAANATTRVHIAWAVPQRHLPDDICANELAAVIHTDRVNMTVYLTSCAVEEGVGEKSESQPDSPYEVHFGRPDFEAIIRDTRSQSNGSLAVVSCGTPHMSDVCRAAMVKILGEEGVTVEYFNESLMW